MLSSATVREEASRSRVRPVGRSSRVPVRRSALAPKQRARREDAPRRRRRLPVALPLVALTAAVALGGYIAGSSGGEVESATREVAVGPLRLQLPATWTETDRPSRVPGLQLSSAASFAPAGDVARGSLLAGTSEGTARTLLPSGFLDRLRRAPATDDAVRLGELEAYRYRDLKPRGLPGSVTVYVVPTARDVATVACLTPRAKDSAAACERAAATLDLDGRSALDLSPRETYARTLDSTMERLDKGRAEARRELRGARSAKAQARAGRKLSRVHEDVGKALTDASPGPAERPLHRALRKDMERLATSYSRLATAARAEDRGRYRAAGSQIRRWDANLARDLQALERLGYSID